jgi:hypothetical protein
MDNKAERMLAWDFFGGTYDIFFGIQVEIALAKGGRVKRVE